MTNQLDRIALIAYLAERSPGRFIGRTALMKLCYLLQTLRRIPLGYNFSLYSYGPFDATVLADVGDAVALGVVREDLVPYGLGYGYQIRNLLPIGTVNELGAHFLTTHGADIEWITEQFGHFSAAELELLSTIVYVDREATQSSEALSSEQLAKRVRKVKPRFQHQHIARDVKSLAEKELLMSLRSQHRTAI